MFIELPLIENGTSVSHVFNVTAIGLLKGVGAETELTFLWGAVRTVPLPVEDVRRLMERAAYGGIVKGLGV